MSKSDKEPDWSQLRTISFKLRGLAFLLECKSFNDVPLDVEDLFYGVSVVFADLGKQVEQIASRLENLEIASERAKTR